MSDSEDSLNASVSSGDAALQDQNFLTKSQSNSIAFEPCVRGATISQERECLRKIREMALDITPESRVSDEMSVYEFAFQYVLTDRTRRKHNIKRAKDRARARQESNSEPQ